MPEKPRILIAEPDDFSPKVVAYLRRYAEVDLHNCQPEDIPEALMQYDVFWFRLAHQLDEKVLHPDMRCKILASPVTGIDHIDESLCQEYGIKIVSLRGEREFLREVRATAEMAIGMAIALMRNIPQAAQSVKAGEWDRDRFRGNELYRKTAGIIGFGRLGRIVAEYFHAFGMQVLACDNRKVEVPEWITFTDSLDELVQQSDLVSLHVNYHKGTHHLIGADVFRQMKNESVFINTSRGGIVDEEALLFALEEGRIKGAALDVLQGEPDIDQDHPLVAYAKTHNNLLILAHIGGNTYESFEKTEQFIAQKVVEEIQSWPTLV